MSLQGITFGAPGVYFASEMAPRALGLEPMDVAAFVGVAPRGPAWEPVGDATWVESGHTRRRSVAVAVDSWDDYAERFGGFEGPGLLPFAVATFFAQGGRSAYVVRIVHDEVDQAGGVMVPLGCATFELRAGDGTPAQQPVNAGPSEFVSLRARNEGTWGNRLRAELAFATVPVTLIGFEPAALVVPLDAVLPAGSLVRLVAADGTRVLRWVTSHHRRGRPSSRGVDLVAELDGPVPAGVVHVERVEATLDIVDRDPVRARRERFEGLGLRPGHPRFLGDVLLAESRLVELGAGAGGIEVNHVGLPAVATSEAVAPGVDRWSLVTPEDAFGRLLEGDDSASAGLDALLETPLVASIVVADLYAPAERLTPVAVFLPSLSAGPEFEPCVDIAEVRHPPAAGAGLDGLLLDPTNAADLEQIVALQQRVVDVAERLGCVVLLDVPPGLRQRASLRWRSRFNSSYAAAYHPWLRAPHPGIDGPLVTVNPSAAAAGIIARCERRQGVPRGPANEGVVGIVDVVDRVDDVRHAELHQAGVDVFVLRSDGVWLTGARTLSSDREWRQLTVRRVVSLIERAVSHQLQWTVFEPNDDLLRAGLKRSLDQLLGELFLQGAFAGDTPDTSWFVHVATGRQLGLESDAGQVIVEVGVAPSQPTEFVVVRVSLDAEGTLQVQAPAVTRG